MSAERTREPPPTQPRRALSTARVVAGMMILATVTLAAQTLAEGGPSRGGPMEWKKLTPAEAAVIEGKGTERPFTGKYYRFDEPGTYTCKRCGAPLFSSDAKFDAGCGWPSFDQALPGAVDERMDADGQRTEIVCARCGAHLGHVFHGEGFTPRSTRHCVNSVSLDFDPADSPDEAGAVAYFAGGCFWGVEHLLQQLPGVLTVESGYMGGSVKKPTYEQVCSHTTGHVETVKVTYDPAKVSYEEVAKRFFEIHDPTQADGQGPDLGPQYRSVIFTSTPDETATIQKLINLLEKRGYRVVTRVEDATRHPFWPAEAYHQDYYDHKGTEPYCHARVKRFGD